jgi:adenosylhomocysteine nucleosidase
MNKTIGIVAALPGEARALVGRRFWEKTNGFLHCRVVLKDGADLAVVQSGMGMENAFSAAHWLSKKGVGALGCFGVSGGLDPGLGIGDLVFADAVFMEQDDGISLAWKRGGRNSEVTFLCGEAKDIAVRWGPIVTVKEAVLNAADKQALFDRTGVLAVDMETAAVVRAASQSGLPFFAVRAVCDRADVSIPESLYQCVDQKGRPRFSYLFRRIIRKPSMISHLLRMKKDFNAALAGAPHVLRCLSAMQIPPAPC